MKLPKTRIVVVPIDSNCTKYFPQRKIFGLWWNIKDNACTWEWRLIDAESVIDKYLNRLQSIAARPKRQIINYPCEIQFHE